MKITDFGVAIVEGDSHLSKWVQEQRRLDVADEFCQLFKPYIPVGGVVFDVGACIGDHTLSYARMVGGNGVVHAFEPNNAAFRCLLHNMGTEHNVLCYEVALGAVHVWVDLEPSTDQPDNLGAYRVSKDSSGGIRMLPIDHFLPHLNRLDFIKIDAEGSEPDIIAGAMQTLARLKPVLLVEINRPVLAERGKSADDIIKPLESLGYTVKPCEGHLDMSMEQLDVLCLP